MPAALALPADATRDLMRQRGLSTREFAMRESSVNEEARSFEAVVSTETMAQVIDWHRYEIIDEILLARGGEFPERVPLLPNHQRYDVTDVIGSADSFRLEGNQWIGRGIVAKSENAADERVDVIWGRVRDRHIRAVSIGYQVFDSVDIAPGKRAVVNGKQYQAGERLLRISTKWRTHELSLTPIGADSMALIRSRLGAPPAKKRSMFR